MKIEHPNLVIESPAPGHYVIIGLPSGSTQTEEGRLVHPEVVHITPDVPDDVLLAIIEDRKLAPVAEVPLDGYAEDRIIAALQDKPLRVNDLASTVSVSANDIKLLAIVSNRFEISGGWAKLVKLTEGGEA
jgi:hypothetical protein